MVILHFLHTLNGLLLLGLKLGYLIFQPLGHVLGINHLVSNGFSIGMFEHRTILHLPTIANQRRLDH